MKRFVILAALGCLTAIVVASRPGRPLDESPAPPGVAVVPDGKGSKGKGGRHGHGRHDLPSLDGAFWAAAKVPEPKRFREPTAVDPAALGVPPVTPPVDHPARIAGLIAAEDDAKLQVAVADWFRDDPTAARDWLGVCESLEPLQPALSLISVQIAGAGDFKRALEWAGLLPEGSELRERTVFEIYTAASRRHELSEEQLRTAPLAPEHVQQLLDGAAGD